MSEHDIQLVTSQAGSVIAENLKVTLGTASAAITPATATAMVGINQGLALDIDANVKASMSKLQEISANVGGVYSADQVSAATTAYSTLTTLQSKLGFTNGSGTDNHAAFGSFLNQAHGHIKDSISIRQSTDFMASTNYSDFGGGITNMSSMVDRGLTKSFGSFSGAGAALASTGSMFNGISIDKIGTPGGIVEAFQNNKLANATGLNQKLIGAGVNINDLHNPAYKDKISSVLGSIKDPAAINMSADQFGQNPFAGLPSYTGSDASLYKTPDFLTGGSATPPSATTVPTSGTSTFGSPSTTGFPTASGYSTSSTAFGASAAPEVGVGGIQSLKDLGDYTKTANPADTAGLSTDLAGIGTKFKDMGAGKIVDTSQATSFFGSLQTASTPLTDSAHPTLPSLMSDLQPKIDSMTGSGTGPMGLPKISDFVQHLSGGADVTAFNTGGSSVAEITAYTNSMTNVNNLWSTAGVDLNSPPPNGLGSSMAFATSLHKFGADTSGSGIAEVLHGMAKTSTKYGESIRASLAEGKNNNLLSANGMGPLKTNPFEGLPAAQGENSLEGGAKLLGG